MIFFHNNLMYETVNVSNLFIGMRINSGLYCFENDNMIKLCHDVTITEELKKTIRRFANKDMQVYADVEEFISIMNQVHANTEKIIQENYIEIKRAAETIYERIEADGVVPEEIANSVSCEVYNKIYSSPPAELIHCINVIRSTDDYLYTHSINVSVLNGLIGKWMKLSQTEIEELIRVGLMHDIGKSKIPKAILEKPAKLTEEEFKVIKTHPVHSYEILRQSGESRENVLLGVKHHHERTNSTGYPSHLSYEHIPLYSRITTISDIYDAMVAKRSYKPSYPPFEILDNFIQNKYVDLDYFIADVFLQNMPYELVGRKVVLSNDEVAEVVFINNINLKHPIVKLNGKMIETNDELRCVSMYDPIFRANRN